MRSLLTSEAKGLEQGSPAACSMAELPPEFGNEQEALCAALVHEGFGVWGSCRAVLASAGPGPAEGRDGLNAARSWLFEHLGDKGIHEELQPHEAAFDDAVLARLLLLHLSIQADCPAPPPPPEDSAGTRPDALLEQVLGCALAQPPQGSDPYECDLVERAVRALTAQMAEAEWGGALGEPTLGGVTPPPPSY